MPDQPFERGDIVIVEGISGPPMLIENFTHVSGGRGDDETRATCVWFDSTMRPQKASFNVDALMLVQREGRSGGE